MQIDDTAVAHFQEHGFAIVRGLVPDEVCDEVVGAFLSEVKPYPGPLPRQLDDRSAPHALSDDGYVTNPVVHPNRLQAFETFRGIEVKVMRASLLVPTVAALLGQPPALLQSAYYESGTGTIGHLDIHPFVSSHPMIGAWIALEDIGEGAGRFFVYPGSHRLPRDERWEQFRQIAWAVYRADVDAEGVEDATAAAIQLLDAMTEEHGLTRHVPALQRGDAVLWSNDVVHGSLRPDPGGGSRHSLLMHFMALADVAERVAPIPGT